MSHVTDWTCRSCSRVLGHVRDSVLRPVATVESVDGRGVARVPCPRCGRVRAWVPSLAISPPRDSAASREQPPVIHDGHHEVEQNRARVSDSGPNCFGLAG